MHKKFRRCIMPGVPRGENIMIPALVLLLLAYLLGSVPFGYLVARARGVDVLRQGSGNIGATNVGRVLGRRFGMLVFVLDCAKGAVPVLAALRVPAPVAASGPLAGLPPDALPSAAGVAAFLGHLFPVFLRFRGGKGVATAAGVVAVLVPVPFLGAFLAWLTVFASTRIMSLASLLAAGLLCVLRLTLTPHPWALEHAVTSGFCLVAAALIIARHHANIHRLLAGNENRFPESTTMNLLAKTLHLYAVGLWFGTLVFFTLAGVLLFETFERKTTRERPAWLPAPAEYLKPAPSDKFPNPLTKEQGSRLAGAAVGPLFPWYFGIQTVCALVALVTALAWMGRGRVHRLRAGVLGAALVAVGVGWWLEQVVEGLRKPRYALTDAVLQSPHPSDADVTAAEEARAKFLAWHNCSLIDNFVILLLVALALGLAARLPEARELAARPTLSEGTFVDDPSTMKT
jgi:acyl phosphate:glycerol-3-phosphate acyltransferase